MLNFEAAVLLNLLLFGVNLLTDKDVIQLFSFFGQPLMLELTSLYRRIKQ